MKKTISIIAAAAMMCAAVSPAFAANRENANPDVFVNGTKIFFEDQGAVIVDGRTLVPARGVFEAMGAKVSWNEDLRQVQIESADDNTWVRLIIDDANMKVYDMSGLFASLFAGQDFEAPETVVELDVAPQIIGDRTMIPLRAISEAINAEANWDEEAYAVQITSEDAPVNEAAESKPTLTLSAASDTVAEGDTVDLYVNVSNLPANTFVSGVTAAVEYNTENFEYVSSAPVNGDTEITNALKDDNANMGENLMKAVYVTVDEDAAAKTDGKVMKLTFKSLNGKEGVFALSDSYHGGIGYNTTLMAQELNSDTSATTYSGDTLYIDTASVTVNAGK